MSKAELHARVKRLQHEGLLTCTVCGESYRVLELYIYPEALCDTNGFCRCQQEQAIFTRRIGHASSRTESRR